jgi:hypothetical protein
MGLRIVTADERLAVATAETTVAIFGAAGAGITSLARSHPPAETVVVDLEAGMKSLQGWGNRCRKSLGHGFAFDSSGK